MRLRPWPVDQVPGSVGVVPPTRALRARNPLPLRRALLIAVGAALVIVLLFLGWTFVGGIFAGQEAQIQSLNKKISDAKTKQRKGMNLPAMCLGLDLATRISSLLCYRKTARNINCLCVRRVPR